MHSVNFREDSPWRGTIIMASQTKVKKSELRDNPELENQRILGSTSHHDRRGFIRCVCPNSSKPSWVRRR